MRNPSYPALKATMFACDTDAPVQDPPAPASSIRKVGGYTEQVVGPPLVAEYYERLREQCINTEDLRVWVFGM